MRILCMRILINFMKAFLLAGIVLIVNVVSCYITGKGLPSRGP